MNYRSYFALLAITAAVLMSGCGVEMVDSDEKAANPETPSTPQIQGPYQLTPLDEPNQYQIQFSPDLQSKMIQTTNLLNGGETYEFRTTSGESFKVEVPKDLVFNQPLSPPADQADWTIETNGRIFLKYEALLSNQDKPLTIKAKEIISEGAQIQTFDETNEAPMGSNGRTGGDIHLIAEKARGSLTVILRGEKGGRGFSGEPHKTVAHSGTSFQMSQVICSMLADGGPGGNGLPGNKGGPGFNGGSSGNLILEVKDSHQLNLQTQLLEGEAGLGGEGGPGQIPGKGGQPGDIRGYVRGTGPTGDVNENLRLDREAWKIIDTYPSEIPIEFPPPPPYLTDCRPRIGPNGKKGAQGANGPVGRKGLKGQVFSN